ncbi:MAG TPA: LLM class flavin-dependent oxidoreductase [Candidatus Binataceae bacterium]|nr:LLM class flavin-dependent oxidoreductase [Candidatus Binataceae bacterium]
MEFGIMFATHIANWDLIRYAEELGYDRAWVPDSHMIWSDCYATLALAAVNTKRIRIGTGIAGAGTRIAPVTAHSIASINRLAPGRVFLGIGSGHTSMRVMGQSFVSLPELREYVHVLRALLAGEEIDYDYRGTTRPIRFLHRDRHFIDLDHPIPIYLAANGPKAIELAGEICDGWIASTASAGDARGFFEHLRIGKGKRARTLGTDFHTSFVTAGCVLRPGEKLSSERVIDETGSQVACNLHLNYEMWMFGGKKDALIPACFANIWEDYLKRVERFPKDSWYQYLYDGHCTFLQPEERRFITPAAIAEYTLTGEPDELIARLREMEALGFDEITLLPPDDYGRKVYRDFAEQVMPALR